MKKIIAMLLLLSTVVSQAQENKGTKGTAVFGVQIHPHTGKTIPCAGSANVATVDLKWKPVLVKKFFEVENEAPDRELVDSIKATKMKLKQQYELTRNKTGEKTTSVTPAIGKNFAGNANDGYTPLDNSIAISKGGFIVCVSNVSIGFYDTTGTALYLRDFAGFTGDTSIHLACDPVTLYDPLADRFIFFCQEVNSCVLHSNNKIIIAFSKTNNPLNGWWIYTLTGDPTGNGDAFDYPKLAINDSELFITGNLFNTPTPTFHQSVVFQVNKSSGYFGAPISYVYYSDIDGAPFTLLPVSSGQTAGTGTSMYLVSTECAGGSVINLYQVTGQLSDSPVMNYNVVATTPYSLAGDAYQLGTSTALSTNDCRALSGFYLNGIIHFVLNSEKDYGYTAINYNRLNVSSLTNTSSLYGTPGYDCAYPSVASFATTTTDKSVLIGFGRSGSSIYPEVRAVNCDNAMSWSGSTLVKASANYVAGYDSTYATTRWGDYTGTCRRHNSTNPSVWMNGMFGTGSHYWNTWISEIHKGAATEVLIPEVSCAKVYPNPIRENFTVEFPLDEGCKLNISVFDLNGKLVKELYKGMGTAGDNLFSFDKSNLSDGIYFLIIRTDSKLIRNEKIVAGG